MNQTPATQVLQQEPLLIVISGPSGVGKDTVLKRMKERRLPFHFVVTMTTREARPEECEGRDYFFVSKDRFQAMIQNEELLEYSLVYNDWKGIPKEQVRLAFQSGKDVIMRLDVQGAEKIKKICDPALLIFITAASEADLVKRLEVRQTEDEEKKRLRIETARQEMKRVVDFDYVIVNQEAQLDHTVDVIRSIIEAEHHRVHPRKVIIE